MVETLPNQPPTTNPSLTDTKAYPYENILLFPVLRKVNHCSLLHWAYSPPYSLSCGGQVPDVVYHITGTPGCSTPNVHTNTL